MFLQLLGSFLLISVVQASLRLNLNNAWILRDANQLYSLPAKVPGGIYSDLMDNGVIEDVFYGYNDVETRWVSKTNWTYSTTFIVNQTIYNSSILNIVFDGVDTFSYIYLNEVLVGTTENMFLQYIFDVKSVLKIGENILEVKFRSPVEEARRLYEIQSLNYTIPPQCVPKEYNGECHVNHLRKMQASFGWDWGPAIPSVGMWKPVYLEAYDYTAITYVTVDIQESNLTESWIISCHVYFSKPPSELRVLQGDVIITFYMDFAKIRKVYTVIVMPNRDGEFVANLSLTIPKSQVNLWWPNGYGSPTRYRMKVAFFGEKGKKSITRFKVGFRTVKLVQNELKVGNSFYFVVNGVPIFAKGTNSIPLSLLPEKGQNLTTIKFLLESVKEANMNMVRVWGGGVYESDDFYEIADDLGIMIWQDFQFACSMYPASDDFLRLVQQEVRHQVRRLQRHPSIVLWAANNENEAALRQNWYGTAGNFSLYKRDYIKLYVDTIRAETLKNDISRPFLVSSPTNGVESEREGYVALTPQSEFYGDVHYYNYILDPWLQSSFPICRFASEYGLQSYPSVSTLMTATNNVSDLMPNSVFMNHRQHHPLGNTEMTLLIETQLELPSVQNSNFYKAFIYYSQIMQAVAMKRQTETYRMWRSKTNDVGQGLTMGALYWQLNDVWAAPSWSGIDFNNRWKMLHYYARNFFSPVIITSFQEVDGNTDLYVVSDLLTNSYNCSATITVYKWDSLRVFHKEVLKVDVLGGYSTKIKSFWTEQYLQNIGCGSIIDAVYNCFIYLSLKEAAIKQIAPDSFVFPSTLKAANLSSPIVTVYYVEQIDKEGILFKIYVKTKGIALFVWLDSSYVRGTFSDNGFIQVVPVEILQFKAETPISVNALRSAITVTHLRDPQYF